MTEDILMQPAAKDDLLADRAHALNVVIVAAVVAIVMLAATSSYSAWVSATAHHTNCGRIDALADADYGIVQLFLAPQQGQTLTAKQFKQVQSFEAASSALLDRARC